jgi:hypothetical protein
VTERSVARRSDLAVKSPGSAAGAPRRQEHAMNHRNVYFRLVAAFVGSFGLVATPVALAGSDEKMFAPQLCVPVEGTDNVSGKAQYRIDAVEQISFEGYQIFMCPLVRDLIAGNLDAVWVWVGNANPKDDTPPECCVYSLSPSNNLYDYACAVAGPGQKYQTLEIDVADFDEVPQGFYVVTCDLGLGDSIHGIRTRES